MKVAAVIVNWNQSAYLHFLLPSLLRLELTGIDLKIIVIDNGSTDDSLEVIAAYPAANLVSHDSNPGLAASVNAGFDLAIKNKCDFIWLLDPATVVHPASLTFLLEAASRSRDTGIFGPKIYSLNPEAAKSTPYPTQIYSAGCHMNWRTLTVTHRGSGAADTGQFEHDIESDILPEASLFIRTRVVAETGPIDPKYYLFFEHLDFQERAKKSGWRLKYICLSKVWYFDPPQDIPASAREYYSTRNALLFGLRFAPVSTKLTLVANSVHLYLKGRAWQRRAVLDFYTGTLGPGSFQL